MINIQLQAQHFYLIAGTLQFNSASYSAKTLNAIKEATAGKADTDTATLGIEVDMFVSVFSTFSQKPEGAYNRPNTEIMDLLTPQIQAGVQAGDPEWISLAEQVEAIRVANWAVSTNDMNNGKQFIESL